MLSLNRCVKAFGARYTASGRGSCRAIAEGRFVVPNDLLRIAPRVLGPKPLRMLQCGKICKEMLLCGPFAPEWVGLATGHKSVGLDL